MKHLRLALVALVSALGLARAQDDQNRAPPTDIPDFSNLDEYVYEPKSILTIGLRQLSGAKTSFSGTGKLLSTDTPGPATGANLFRVYHDGSVSADSRVAARIDSGGNPVIDPLTGGQVFDPVASDGHTNTWSYTDPRQVRPDGMIEFHSYSAEVTDPTVRHKDANSSYGVEVAVSRDMGSLFRTRASWSLMAGVSMNDISAKTTDQVQAAITTLTDVYSLDGQTPPALVQTTTPVLNSSGQAVLNADGTAQTTVTGTTPYSSPSSKSITVVDSAGNAVLNDDGSTQTVTTDTTVLLGSQPANRTTATVVNSATVTNRWKLKGAYYTFRAGPTVWVPVTKRFRFSFSAGVAMVVAGTYYEVTQSFTPDLGAEITDAPPASASTSGYSYNNTNTSSVYKFLPGYFAEAALQFDLTDRTGFYAGAAFQSTGTFDQKLQTDTLNYLTKVDLSRQQGLRAGMTVRF